MESRCVSPRRYESPARDAAAEETRQRIVTAAGEILAGPKGFAGMSLEAVAKAARVTRLTIYNQFGTRRAYKSVTDAMNNAPTLGHQAIEFM